MALIPSFSRIGDALQSFRKHFASVSEIRAPKHFTCFFPENKGVIASKVCSLTFNRIPFKARTVDKVFQLNEKGIVIYTGKYKSLFEFLYFSTIFKKKALPYPEIAFDFNFLMVQPMQRLLKVFASNFLSVVTTGKLHSPYTSGFFSSELVKGRSGFLYLIESSAFYKRFVKAKPDPLKHLIQLQKQIARPIYFIPEVIVFSSRPIRTNPGLLDILLGNNEKPSILRRLFVLVKNPEKICIEMSDPVNLKAFLQRPDIEGIDIDYQASKLRSYLIDVLNRQRRSVTGPILKSREELTEDILTRESLQTFMKDLATSRDQSLVQIHKRASAYIEEIAANYSLTIIYMFERVLTWVFRTIFEGLSVDQEGLNTIKEEFTKAPVVLVPCHKSHLDYLLLSYVMFKNSMPCPHIAAGHNLSFWPLGYFFRGGGAFFLRRTFKGKPLYARIFASYIEKLLYEGFNIEFFIEGGRSRTGKLLPPKLGFLSMLLAAHNNNACEDLIFVPTYVGYDRVLEEDAYLKEIEGGRKNPENLSQLIRARKVLKKKYGKVYIKFAEPMSLNAYLSEQKAMVSGNPEEKKKQVCQNLGYKLVNAINSISIITPHGIIASAVLNCPANRFSKKDLMFRVETYMDFLTFTGAELADTLTIDPDQAFSLVIESFISRKFIELADESEGDISEDTRFILKDNKRPILDYYKNNAIAFFVPVAYTAITILQADTFQFSEEDLTEGYRFLQTLFVDEFSFDEDTTCEQHISTSLKAFVSEGIIVPTPNLANMYNLTSEGFRKLKCFAGFLNPFLESYLVALYYFETQADDQHDDKERIKKVQSIGIKMYRRQEILLKESLSKINYINACKFFMSNGIAGPENMPMISRYKQTLESLLSISSTYRP